MHFDMPLKKRVLSRQMPTIYEDGKEMEQEEEIYQVVSSQRPFEASGLWGASGSFLWGPIATWHLANVQKGIWK